MPVTGKLSHKFYERLGEEIANELVDWFNAVDATYQSQLRELNEANWQRVESRLGAFEARLDGRLAAVDARMEAFELRIDRDLSRQRVQIIGWMFAFWTATVVPIIGAMLALSGAFHR